MVTVRDSSMTVAMGGKTLRFVETAAKLEAIALFLLVRRSALLFGELFRGGNRASYLN
jgi:hypothetical protein